ncbi:sensor domain-containing diguanylate cyclase [Fredinandcohnia humi]
MEVSNRVRKGLWLVWFLVFPVSMWLLYSYTNPIIAGYELDIVSFLLITGIISILPIVVNNIPIMFTEGVSLTIFLFFGLFIDIIITQVAIILLLIRVKISVKEWYRIPLNSLLFLTMSVTSAAVYYLLGGTHGAIDMSSPSFLIPIVGYQFTRFFMNHVLLRLIKLILDQNKEKQPLITKDVIWEGATMLVHFPVGLVLYMLYVEVGLIALFYVGIPLVSLAFILRLYYSSQRINDYLQQATEIGYQLAGRLKVEEVLDVFIEKICKMLPVEYAYILDVVDEKELNVIRYFSKVDSPSRNFSPLKKDEGIAGRVWSTQKATIFRTRKEFRDITKGYLPESVESAICVPVIRNKQVVGVFALASTKKHCYENYQLMIVEILSSYLAVAIENARLHEETKTKSEICSLTRVYNYRYFEQVLEAEFLKLENKSHGPLSLILLDIDHFKTINDNFGHQGGNEILRDLAHRLQNLIGSQGTVARYGGEEFVILLPNTDKRTCYELAETIRQMISNRPFTIQDDLQDRLPQQKMVRITASIGFATAPNDAETPLELVRYADRAMYIGAKQAGRNRVAEYVHG